MAIAAGVKPLPARNRARSTATSVVPLLFDHAFPSWFAGIAFRRHRYRGALVPPPSCRSPRRTSSPKHLQGVPREERLGDRGSPVSKIASLVVKVGAVACIVFLDPQFSIDLQLIGGVIILQTLPAVAIGLYTRWFHRGALIAGWVAGNGLGRLDALRDPESGDQARALRRFGVPTGEVRSRHFQDSLRWTGRRTGQPGGRGSRDLLRPGEPVPDGADVHHLETTISPRRTASAPAPIAAKEQRRLTRLVTASAAASRVWPQQTLMTDRNAGNSSGCQGQGAPTRPGRKGYSCSKAASSAPVANRSRPGGIELRLAALAQHAVAVHLPQDRVRGVGQQDHGVGFALGRTGAVRRPVRDQTRTSSGLSVRAGRRGTARWTRWPGQRGQ